MPHQLTRPGSTSRHTGWPCVALGHPRNGRRAGRAGGPRSVNGPGFPVSVHLTPVPSASATAAGTWAGRNSRASRTASGAAAEPGPTAASGSARPMPSSGSTGPAAAGFVSCLSPCSGPTTAGTPPGGAGLPHRGKHGNIRRLAWLAAVRLRQPKPHPLVEIDRWPAGMQHSRSSQHHRQFLESCPARSGLLGKRLIRQTISRSVRTSRLSERPLTDSDGSWGADMNRHSGAPGRSMNWRYPSHGRLVARPWHGS